MLVATPLASFSEAFFIEFFFCHSAAQRTSSFSSKAFLGVLLDTSAASLATLICSRFGTSPPQVPVRCAGLRRLGKLVLEPGDHLSL